MSTGEPLPGLLTPEAALHRLADRLSARFAGVFARETIDRYVFESYTALARTAKVTRTCRCSPSGSLPTA
jgi:arsenate reductase